MLNRIGLGEKRIVFFTSDNGSAEGWAEGWEEMLNSCIPLRGRKSSLNEGGIRCPMIARWPGQIPPGTVSNAVWHLADFLATGAAIAGAKASSEIGGVDVTPVLLGETDSLPDRFLYWEKRRDEPVQLEQAVRWGDGKAFRFSLDKPMKLYNLRDDIGEENDVSKRYTP